MFTASYDHQMLQCNNHSCPIMDRKWKSNGEKVAPNCPRCASSNTKFCYYNNYSLSQPRYFCKGCRRYWTKGGSLRNVPVGGGCRKNRRSKSVRLAQKDHLGGFDSNPNEPFGSSASPDDAGPLVQPSRSSSDIDLAVVFAKFLNDQTNQEFPDAVIDVSDSLYSDSGQNETVLIESHEPLDFAGEVPALLEEQQIPDHQVVPVAEKQQEEKQRVGEFVENDQFGLLSLLDDEVIQDALWSHDDDSATTINPSFSWQPIVQLQDFDSFPVDDQLNIPANLITDNWSSFDLSGFEVFSKP